MAPPREVRRLPAATAAYIAGLVDGEGTVTLSRQHRNEGRRLTLSISSTERVLLEFVKDAVGAGRITGKRTYSARHAPSYAYAVTSRQAIAVLEQIAPHLRSYKKSRATLALRHYVELTPRNGRYTRELRDLRARFEMIFLALRPEYGHTAKSSEKAQCIPRES